MLRSISKTILGLDIGQATVKAVALKRVGGSLAVVDCAILDLRKEGILDERELWQQLGTWLEQNHFATLETVAGIPQYFATTQVCHFPVNDDTSLGMMVEQETRHLAGLSDERFIHNYCAMPAADKLRTPVLIGICRAALVEEQYASLQQCGIKIAEMGLNGTAHASACLALAKSLSTPDMFTLALDIGSDNTILTVLQGNTALHISSVPAGIGDNGSSCDKNETNHENTMVRQILAEVTQALEHWREHEPSAAIVADSPDRVLISGGGACSTLLQNQLEKHFGRPAEVVGIKVGECINPLFTTAYGLALLGLNKADFSVSLLPTGARANLLHRRRFKFAAAAVLLLAGLIGFHEARLILSLRERIERIGIEVNDIEKSQVFVPDLENVSIQAETLRDIILPVATKVALGQRYLTTVQTLSDACEKIAVPQEDPRLPNAWVVYLADSQSANRHLSSDAESAPEIKPRRFPLLPSGPAHGGQAGATTDTQPAKEKWYTVCQATSADQASGMIAAIMTPTVNAEPFKFISRLIRTLELHPALERVDLLSPQDQTERDDVFMPWNRALFINNIRNHRGFMIRIPFAGHEP